jgi:hypothetical protein
MYRCEALSISGFIQQLAVAFVARGYRFYVTGCIPLKKEARTVDRKLIERYGINCSKWVRYRRKERGLANIQYLRFRRFFVLLATAGEHDFFLRETGVQDIRRRPIQCFGYSIGCYRGQGQTFHPSVRIERRLFSDLKAEFISAALKETVEDLISRFSCLPAEPYAPVRGQLRSILRAVNRKRKEGGLEGIPPKALRSRRKPVRVFGSIH